MRPQGVPELRHPHLAMSHPALKVSPRPRVEALSISPVMSFCSPSRGGTSQTLNTVPTPAHAHPSLRTRHSPSTAAIRVCETGDSPMALSWWGHPHCRPLCHGCGDSSPPRGPGTCGPCLWGATTLLCDCQLQVPSGLITATSCGSCSHNRNSAPLLSVELFSPVDLRAWLREWRDHLLES